MICPPVRGLHVVNPWYHIRNSNIIGCPPVRGDNPRALASGLSPRTGGQTLYNYLYHLHQCRPCTSRDSSCLSW